MLKFEGIIRALAVILIPTAALSHSIDDNNCSVPIGAEHRALLASLSEETKQRLRTLRSVTAEDRCRMPVESLRKAIRKLDHPRPDFPGEAQAFRYEQQLSENRYFDARNWLAARQHVKDMRQWVQPVTGIAPLNWESLGPGNIGGRIRSLAFDPDDATRIYAGAVSGGVWVTEDAGASWAPTDDFMANLSVSTLIFDPTNSSTMFAGTGEGTFNSDNIRGLGIFTSVDKGASWAALSSTTDNFDFYWVNRLTMLNDASRLVAATHTGIWTSADTGVTWSQAYVGRMNDVDIHPTNDLKAIAGSYGNGAVGGDGAAALYSEDGGLTWIKATGLEAVSFSRVEVAYARSNPDIVFASIENSGGEIYKSADGGQSYALVNTGNSYLGSQGWYDNALWIDPTNADHIIVGGIDLWRSTDGGATLTRISLWFLAPQSAHADHHFVVEHPDYDGISNKRVYFANDGGVYTAADIELAQDDVGWQELNNNLAITQFYGFGIAPNGVIVGGTQDNGTLIYRGDSEGWTTTFGGDGGFSAADPTDPNFLYGEFVRLQIHRSTNGGAFSSFIFDPAMLTGANFIAPLTLDPNNENRLLGGADELWVSDNVKDVAPVWVSLKSAIGSSSSISAIAVTPGNSDIIYVGHNDGSLYKTINGTAPVPNWILVGDAELPQRFLLRIAIDPVNPDIVFASFGGYSPDNLWKSIDGGINWITATGTAPASIPQAPIRAIAIHPGTTNQVYVGTEVGIFASDDGGVSWSITNDGPANVSVDELTWVGEATLYAATHGRGVYRLDLNQTTPNTIVFDTVIDAPLSTELTTVEKNISGLGTAVNLSIEGGEYSLPCTNIFTTDTIAVSNGDSFCLRHTTSANQFTVTRTKVTIGSSTFIFESRTLPDIAPDPFSFLTRQDVELGSEQISDPITLTGISFQAGASVINGDYSIGCNGIFVSTGSVVTLGDSICVRHIASNEHLMMTTTTLTLGTLSGDFDTVTLPDTTPDGFSFAAVDDVPVDTVQVSNAVTVAGFQVALPISVTNGEYSIGCNSAGFTAIDGNISPNDSVCVRHTSSASYVSQVTSTLDVNGVTAEFLSTTMPDRTPDDFSFGSVTNAELSTTQTSETATITGIAVNVDITIAGGEYSIGCTDTFVGAAGTMTDGDTVCLRHTSSAAFSTQTQTTVNIGTGTQIFMSTTKAAPPLPPNSAGSGSGGGGGSLTWLLLVLAASRLILHHEQPMALRRRPRKARVTSIRRINTLLSHVPHHWQSVQGLYHPEHCGIRVRPE